MARFRDGKIGRARLRVDRNVGKTTMTTRNMLDGGQVIVDYLIREHVPYVFGLCGHGNIQFFDALYERLSYTSVLGTAHTFPRAASRNSRS